MALTREQIAAAKGRGFLHNRGTDCLSARIVTKNGVVSSEQLRGIAEAAQRHGTGQVTLTTRLSMEVPGIPFDTLEAFRADIEALGLEVGGTGPKVRPIVACKGTTCVFGLADTHSLALELHRRFYQGWANVVLPHKFKIAVGGCPNHCVKPDLNDFAIVGYRKASDTQEALYTIYLGGHWGRTQGPGTPLSIHVTEEQALSIAEKALLLFKKEGVAKERFGVLVHRLGIEEVERLLLSGQLLLEKESILKN